MNRAKAIKLLEMLRRRTEARGATPAEAAQAIELAERLMKRYNIAAPDVSETKQASMQLQTKVCPFWCRLLAFGIERRFKLQDTTYTRAVGERSVVTFVGPEHIASVAAWLFRAIANDLMTRAQREARRRNVSGPALVRFRNRFCQCAASELYSRLNPPTEQELLEAEQRLDESEPRCSRERKVEPLPDDEVVAMFAGYEAGRDVSIDTNAVGGAQVGLIGHSVPKTEGQHSDEKPQG